MRLLASLSIALVLTTPSLVEGGRPTWSVEALSEQLPPPMQLMQRRADPRSMTKQCPRRGALRPTGRVLRSGAPRANPTDPRLMQVPKLVVKMVVTDDHFPPISVQ